MAINTIATASKYTDALDKMVVQKSETGFFTDNVFGAKFVGAKTVVMPDVSFIGLADYDRDNGFSKAGITVAQTSFELTKDRGRKLQIDREDMDETGVANLAGQILGEYVRTMVVPEMDAYVLSKLAGIASTRSHKTVYAQNTGFAQLNTAINNVYSRAGYDTELIAFVDSTMYSLLMNTNEIARQLVIGDFKKGEINTRVRYLNDVAIIPVSDERMRDSYTFEAGTAASSGSAATGGFKPASSAGYVRALVVPKKGAHLVKKTEQMRIFTPEQNIDADAYTFNYRIHYDVFVKKSGLDMIESIVTAGA